MITHWLRKGQRVRLSREGIEANLVHPKHHTRHGTVTHDQTVPLGVSVLWDGKKTPVAYARRFITAIGGRGARRPA